MRPALIFKRDPRPGIRAPVRRALPTDLHAATQADPLRSRRTRPEDAGAPYGRRRRGLPACGARRRARSVQPRGRAVRDPRREVARILGARTIRVGPKLLRARRHRHLADAPAALSPRLGRPRSPESAPRRDPSADRARVGPKHSSPRCCEELLDGGERSRHRDTAVGRRDIGPPALERDIDRRRPEIGRTKPAPLDLTANAPLATRRSDLRTGSGAGGRGSGRGPVPWR